MTLIKQKTTHIAIVLFLIAMLTGCGKKEKDYDATGVFEATEVTVSAEQNGRLLSFDVNEGSRLNAGERVGLIDTVQLYLKAKQIGATKNIYASQRPDMSKQVASLRQQLEKAEREQQRFAGLLKDGAATQKQYDDAANAVKVLRREIDAVMSSLGNNTNSLNAQMGTAEIQKYQVMDMLDKCRIIAPISGTVIEKYTERGEYAVMGKPLFRMADTENMYLRAYVTSAQLGNIRIGQKVKVYSDYGSDIGKAYKGTVTWISERSEFTPKTILTKDERAELVYAVKVSVKNDGYIKIGMYGKLKL